MIKHFHFRMSLEFPLTMNPAAGQDPYPGPVPWQSYPHCAKNNLNPRKKSEPVLAGVDRKAHACLAYVYLLYTV